MAGEVTQDRERDVDEEVGTAACDAVYADGWDWGEFVSLCSLSIVSTRRQVRTEDCDDDEEDC